MACRVPADISLATTWMSEHIFLLENIIDSLQRKGMMQLALVPLWFMQTICDATKKYYLKSRG